MSNCALKLNETTENAILTVNSDFDTLTGPFTFECWIKGIAEQMDGSGSHGLTIVCHGHYSPMCGFSLQIRDNNKFGVQLGLSGNLVWSTSAIDTTNWQHVAVVYDGTELRIYINGTKEGWGNWSAYAAQSMPFTVGSMAIAQSEAFAGWIDEVRYSSSVRYTNDFTPQTTQFTSDANTIFLYHLDEGTGTAITDSSSNSHSATVTGTNSWVDGYVTSGGGAAGQFLSTNSKFW